jgi:hypothetical protein
VEITKRNIRVLVMAVGGERGYNMSTDRQIAYYKSLCRQLGQEPDDSFENLTIAEASKAITELNEMLDEKRTGWAVE